MRENEKLERLLEENNNLLRLLLDTISEGIHVKRQGNDAKYATSTPLNQDDFDSLDEEIDLDWWYEQYREKMLPAKSMNRSGNPFEKREMDHMFRRLLEISSVKPEVNEGSHIFTYVGKKYSKTEKNTFNCFQCVPVEESS